MYWVDFTKRAAAFLTSACLALVIVAGFAPRAEAQPTLSASPASIRIGGTVTTNWIGITTPSSTDWIGLYAPGAANTAFIDWIYVSCSKSAGNPIPSGSCLFTLPAILAPGPYELRLFTNNSYTALTSSNAITVTATTFTLTANPASVSSGGSITATWSGIAAPAATDWIGIYAPNTPSTAFLDWIYVSCSRSAGSPIPSGSCSLTLPGGLAPGSYELRLFSNSSYTILGTSNSFAVTAANITLNASPTSVSPGGSITATWSGIAAPTPSDWIGLYLPNTAGTAFLDWIYVSCSKSAAGAKASGSCAFPLPAALTPGTYELRLFANNVFTALAISNAFSVGVSGTGGDLARLLEQATFGPTTALVASAQQSGIDTYLNQQLSASMQDYPDLPFWPQTRPATCIETCQRDNYTYYQVQRHFFANALSGQDQLRQRVAFGLSQILVTSQTDVPMPAWMRSYQQLLYRGAFGNFRQLLYDVTLHPTMGRFLDMLGSRCQRGNPLNVNICRNGLTSQPNENYAREVLQLFSLGTFLLNQDGTRQLDNSGNPIPSYDQKTIEEFARVFTGWGLAAALPSPDPSAATVPNYRDPMVQHLDTQNREDYHDRGQKMLLNNTTLQAGRTASQDLSDAIDNIAFHPNVAPFIGKQLIQQLVTSNPSPAYVARIAAVFTANRNSATQLFQVVKAILLDPEARGDTKDPVSVPNYGKLREPVLFITNILRAFNATSDGILNNPGGGIGTADMSEDLFNAPSVFNYFPPGARVPAENAAGPEFAIFSSLTSLRRANFVNQVIFSTIAPALPDRPLGTSINLDSFDSLAANPDQLLDTLNKLLLHGSMSAEMRQNIKTAVTAVVATNARLRVRTAIYLIATSSQYQVQR